MRNTRLMTVSICAVLLGAMTAFHVYGETSSSSSAAETASSHELECGKYV